ncbi:MAG TPA: SUF system Fe-S cluster assembly regulator [Anaeromyxobacteraceae bacterium]
MSKLTDYGLVLLTNLAQGGNPPVQTAHELAARSGVPVPTVSKILKELSKAGIVVSHRGRRGGYSLSRSPDQISVAAVVEALEGPVALTECSTTAGGCSLEPVCLAKGHWGPISRAIQRTLQRLPLSALGPHPRPVMLGRPPALAAPPSAPPTASITEMTTEMTR